MGRYTLVMDTLDKQRVSINLSESGKTKSKVSLKTIDDLTTQTVSPEELAIKLNVKGKASGFKITYISNKVCLSLPIAYSDKRLLSRVKLQGGSNINVDNAVFRSVMYDFLRKLESKDSHNQDFYRFAMESSLLNSKQKEYILRRISSGDYTEFCESKIRAHSSTYRQFRNILFLMEQYDMRYKPKEEVDLSYEEDDYDPDKEGFFTEEEKKAYQEYLDNLPDENYEFPYRKRRDLHL